MADAIAQIESLERDPIPYTEIRPRHDLTGWAHGVAALGLLLLALAALAEADVSARRVAKAADEPARRAA